MCLAEAGLLKTFKSQITNLKVIASNLRKYEICKNFVLQQALMHARKEVIDKFRWYCLNMDYSNNELTGAPTDKIIRKLKFARIKYSSKKISRLQILLVMSE